MHTDVADPPTGSPISSDAPQTATHPVPAEAASRTEPALTPLWRNWRFQVLWVGSSASSLGLSAADFAYPVVILAMTRSPLMAALFGFIQITASVVAGIPVGALVDRFDRRHVLICTEAARALVTASVAVAWALGHLTVVHLFVVAAVLGAGSPLAAARMLVVRAIVPPRQLTQALTQEEVRAAASGLAGPPLGGALLAASRALPFLVGSLTFVVSFTAALIVRIPASPREAATPAVDGATNDETEGATDGATTPKEDNGALRGLREVWANPMIRATLTMISLINIGGVALSLAVVVLLLRQGVSPQGIGIAIAGEAVGNLIGAPFVGRLHRRIAPGILLLLAASMFVVFLPLLAIPNGPWWVCGVLAVSMLGVPAVRVLIDVLILRQVPDERRGRTITAMQTVMVIGIPFGTLAGGVCLQVLGAPVTILAICAVVAIAVVIGASNRALRTAQWPAA